MATNRAAPNEDPGGIGRLVAGLAASAFRTGRPDAAAILAALARDTDAGELIARIEAARASTQWGLDAVPAPAARLAALRARLKFDGLDGFLVPLADEHQGEFIPPRAQRLAWLTGFGGSAGLAIVLADTAAIFVDGRYTLQVRDQVDVAAFAPHHVTDSPPDRWLAETAPRGARIGFDPWLHTPAGLERLRAGCEKAGAELVPVAVNPLDAVWDDQPPPPLGPVEVHSVARAGRDSSEKRAEIGAEIARQGCDAVVLSAPDSIAWLLNVRGSDVPNTPLALSYAILKKTGAVEWFVDAAKLSPAVVAHVGDGVCVKPPEAFGAALDALGAAQAKVRIDRNTAPAWIATRLEEAQAVSVPGPDPCILPKARKNAAELAGTRAAHVRDGAALTRFLAWLAAEAPKGGVTEMAASRKLYEFRKDVALFRGTSFETIAGSGPNGAIVHYRVTEATDRTLRPGEVFLLDSGGQYEDGTTDITRTVYIADGNPAPAEVRDRNTRVLKGHIAVATARFPAGTTGSQIDALARLPLWQAGLDYDHGTGHGVGSYLGVHEGPQRISKVAGSPPLEPGMIVSNEPGYYKTGGYGIRIENLVVVRKETPEGAERDTLGFETITLAPIDRALIAPDLLTPEERAWLDAYHVRVRETLSPLVDAATRVWLEAATAPI